MISMRARRVLYFMPDSNDRVDPDFDFLTETHSGGKGGWSNEVYGHQLLGDLAADGFLVSRAVSRTALEAKRLQSMGMHCYMRTSSNVPMFGDPGAFSYRELIEPPLSTEDAVEHYSTLGFTHGVSVDHLVFNNGPDALARYNLTRKNAKDFFLLHRTRGCKWVPVGAVQGWDPDSYAAAARELVEVGYRYLALGGLVASDDARVLDVVRAVRTVVHESVDLHVFGVARTSILPAFTDLRVTSVDGASPMRSAWLHARKNYWIGHDAFAAIRVPEPSSSPKALKAIREGRISASDAKAMDTAAMAALRGYTAGSVSLDGAVDAVRTYVCALGDDGDMRDTYRTLSERPWNKCACNICRKSGVDVVIFRGNNRNRRRGMHNHWVFYKNWLEASR